MPGFLYSNVKPFLLIQNLQVPSWRVKVFTSCYTMEGTENLSDDVFDRRHSRLEIDERRRKRYLNKVECNLNK